MYMQIHQEHEVRDIDVADQDVFLKLLPPRYIYTLLEYNSYRFEDY